MTLPDPTAPPITVGLAPLNAQEVNNLIGTHLRTFTQIKHTINQDHEWLLTCDLKAAPYYFDDVQETLMKSAIGDLDTALDAIDMTFISRLTGMY
jgi:hypothetical protein